MSHPLPDDQARAFLTTLFRLAPAGTFMVVSELVDGSWNSTSFPVNDLDGASAYARQRASKNLYVRVCPSTQAFTGSSRGKAADTASVGALWLDCDLDKQGNPPDRETAERLMDDAGIPAPSLVVHSGHGLHFYWLLANPVVGEAMPPLLKRWKQRVLTAFEAGGYVVDKAPFDLARVLGVPGTTNAKEGREPQPVTLQALHEDRLYEPSQLAPEHDDHPPAAPSARLSIASGTWPDADNLRPLEAHLARLPMNVCDDYHEWIRVGMAIHNESPSDHGLALWRTWSMKSKKYQPEDCDRKWPTFKGSGLTAGTLVYLSGHQRGGEDHTSESAPGASGTTAPKRLKWRAFPLDALPGPARRFVVTASTAIGCDPSFVALPLLAGLASAIGNARRILAKDGWSEPAVLWCAIVGESGTSKSPALEAALRPIHKLQEQACRDYKAAMTTFDADAQRYEKDLARWRKAKEDSDPPQKPEEPTWARYWAEDVTIEALAPLLQDNPRGLLVIRDELAGWLHFDRYSAKGGGSEAARWLEMHGARQLIADRKTSGTTFVRRAAVSIVGGIQPGILERHIGEMHRDSGLLARLLLAMPPRKPKQWTDAGIPAQAEAEIEAIFESLCRLPFAQNAHGEPEPAIVTLTEDGANAFHEFYNDHANEQVTLVGDLAAAWAKLEGYALRLALIHHMVRAASGEIMGDGVDRHSVEAAVTLVRWLGHEARRVYATMGESDAERERRRLIELIQLQEGQVSVRDWQRRRSHPTTTDARAELDGLVKAGFGQWREIRPERGGKVTSMFVLDTAPADDAESTDEAVASVAMDEDWRDVA